MVDHIGVIGIVCINAANLLTDVNDQPVINVTAQAHRHYQGCSLRQFSS